MAIVSANRRSIQFSNKPFKGARKIQLIHRTPDSIDSIMQSPGWPGLRAYMSVCNACWSDLLYIMGRSGLVLFWKYGVAGKTGYGARERRPKFPRKMFNGGFLAMHTDLTGDFCIPIYQHFHCKERTDSERPQKTGSYYYLSYDIKLNPKVCKTPREKHAARERGHAVIDLLCADHPRVGPWLKKHPGKHAHQWLQENF